MILNVTDGGASNADVVQPPPKRPKLYVSHSSSYDFLFSLLLWKSF